MRRFFTATVLTLAFFGAFVLVSELPVMAQTDSGSTGTTPSGIPRPPKAKAKAKGLAKKKKVIAGAQGASASSVPKPM